jgi:plasmid replication initiation protein
VNEQRFSVEEFRALLSVGDGQYPGFPQLKQKVIAPAVLEVNALSDFKVEVEPVRDGGLVRGPLIGFVLRWEKKSSEEWGGVLDELTRARVGRRARIEGKVERIT